MIKQEATTYRIAFLTLAASFMWGFNFPALKLITSYLPHLFTVGLRFILMGMILLLPLIYNARPSKNELFNIFISSILVYALPLGGHVLAFQWVDSSIIALTSQFDPIVLIFMGAFFFKEKISINQIYGMIIAIVGMFVIVQSPELKVNHWKSLTCIILPTFSWAGGMLYTKKIKLPGSVITGYSIFMAAIPVLILSFIFETDQYKNLSMMPFDHWLLYLLTCCFTVGGYCIYTYIIKKVDVNKTAPYLLTSPLFSIISGYFLIGEILDNTAFIGGLLILLGVLISTIKFKFCVLENILVVSKNRYKLLLIFVQHLKKLILSWKPK